MNYFIAAVLLLVLLILLLLVMKTHRLAAFIGEETKKGSSEEDLEPVHTALNMLYAAIVAVCLVLTLGIYLVVAGTAWESHLREWLNIVIRLMHITFGIAWIGASFYFVFLENALNRTENIRDELAGDLWAVHGGGFYYLEKYKTAPKVLPKHLHWFKYEAYFTWLTGFSLLIVVYYFNADALLLDKNVLDIAAWRGIGAGIISFIIGWLLYDSLCKSALLKQTYLFIAAGFLIICGFAYFYTQIFSARAAFIHFGALLGTIMAANVFFVIIPSQKEMVRAAKAGVPLNPALGKHAGLRSLHNNYFTLPVLFVMISNHFPSTFGYEYPWLSLLLITVGTAGVKHYLNLKEKKQSSTWVLPLSVLVLLGAALVTAPPLNPEACDEEVAFAQVNEIVQQRCISCHSSQPTDDIYKSPPNGVVYDTPEDIMKKKDLILQRVVLTKTMPPNNKTNITEAERKQLRCWIEQGAPLQ